MKNILNIIVFTTLFVSNSHFLMAESAPEKFQSSSMKKPLKQGSKKNAHGFWENDVESALNEATKLKKPLLIDFYGIWCPPCNQLDELVFSTAKFKAAAKKYVLLKLDADSEKSWVLKSKYNVGGYPTILFTTVEDNQPTTEIDRIVGYYPVDIITKKMSEALLSDGKTNHKKIIDQIEKAITASNDLSDDKAALEYAEAGLILDPKNVNFKLSQLSLKAKDDSGLLRSQESKKMIQDMVTDRKSLSVLALNQLFEISPSKEIIDELTSRINPETLYIDNEGYTAADVYAMGIDLAETEKNETSKKIYLDLTIEAYAKLLKKYGEDSRSLNLSYTYYLQQANQTTKAKNVYEKMLAKYPIEFTFYYQAVDFALGQKDFSLAKNYAEKSIQFAYGDNLIRSYGKKIKVSVESYKARNTEDEKSSLKTSISETEKFILEFKKPEGVKVRTDRYLKKLIESLAEAKNLL